MNRKINSYGKKALDVIVSTWIELYSDGDSPPPEGYNLIFPYTGFRELAISMTKTDLYDKESINYLIDWNRYCSINTDISSKKRKKDLKFTQEGIYVSGPVIKEIESHDLNKIIKKIHEKFLEEEFKSDGKVWHNIDPYWAGYNGNHFSYEIF